MEKTNSYNIAIDWAFWNNRIYGSLDVYYKKGVDQVVTKNVAPSTGASSVSINDGDVENKGWDLAVSFVPIQTRDWMWSLSFNTGKNYNKVLNAGNSAITWQDYIAGTLVSNGNAINSFYSYKFDKLDDQVFLHLRILMRKMKKEMLWFILCRRCMTVLLFFPENVNPI